MLPTKDVSLAAHKLQPSAVADGDAKARRLAYLTVFVPAFGFVAAIAYAVAYGVGWLEMALLGGMYFLTSFGVEGGLHRFFSHRAFKAGPLVTMLIGILGCMAAQGPILFWAATHRMHHVFTDRDGDPHSPVPQEPGFVNHVKALWHGHVGWLFSVRRANWSSYVPDLLADRRVLWVNQRYMRWVLLGLVIPAAIGAAVGGLDGALRGFLWGGLARIFLLDQATWAVNSLAHTIGSRPHVTRDKSGNVAFLALFTAGGSWHNNHHANPSLAHNDLHFWQIDIAAWVIRFLAMVGLAWDVRRRRDAPEEISEASVNHD
ncbi:acyl-CoA desaturase [Paraherbaspirillum soli]|uniref:Acyl-CoA desaturase n=1 Tax=Paraherbaspirillum soli TaxID=631222 RepID=A0ABW0MGT5_9BURK